MQSDTAAPLGYRPLEARRWEARNRQVSAASAENNTLVAGSGGTAAYCFRDIGGEYRIAVLEVDLRTVAAF